MNPKSGYIIAFAKMSFISTFVAIYFILVSSRAFACVIAYISLILSKSDNIPDSIGPSISSSEDNYSA